MNLKELVQSFPFELERSLCRMFNTKYGRRPSSAPFISGDSFRAFADFIIESENDVQSLENGSSVPQHAVIFIHTEFLHAFGKRIMPHLEHSVILITHGSDRNITDEYAYIADSAHITHWFAINCAKQHPNITPIPIGLENQWYHNSGCVRSFKKLQRMIHQTRTPKVLVALNFATNPQKRFDCYKAFWHKPVTEELPSFISSDLYRKLAVKYMFIASPEGNGLDCHRTWEAMYLGVVPLVEDSYMNRYFASLGLPLLPLANWDMIASKTQEELAALYADITAKADRQALAFSYWTQKIEAYKKP